MSHQTPIEWTDATWNPVRGCTKISPGCKHCYAETFAVLSDNYTSPWTTTRPPHF
jgi:protein gp37